MPGAALQVIPACCERAEQPSQLAAYETRKTAQCVSASWLHLPHRATSLPDGAQQSMAADGFDRVADALRLDLQHLRQQLAKPATEPVQSGTCSDTVITEEASTASRLSESTEEQGSSAADPGQALTGFLSGAKLSPEPARLVCKTSPEGACMVQASRASMAFSTGLISTSTEAH